jgi:hypothetical protein
VNGIGDTTRLADAHTDPSAVVAHHRDDTKSKAPPALDNIRNPCDIYDVFVQFFSIRHSASVKT